MEDEIQNHIPLDVIELIVSKVPTEDAVRTSVLSKECQHLWKHSRFIDVDIARAKNLNRDGFIHFVDGVLHKSPSDLHSFKLSCSDLVSVDRIWSWVRSSLNKNVTELDLNFRVKEDDSVRLPGCLGTSRSLEVLKLNLHCSRLFLRIATNQLMVRVLELYNVNFMGRGVAWALFYNSTSLEELVLVGCDLGGNQAAVSCLSLKKLKFHDVRPHGVLMLDCPNLLRLDYKGVNEIKSFDGKNTYAETLPTITTLVLTYNTSDQLVQFLRNTPVLESIHLVFNEELKKCDLVDALNCSEASTKLSCCLKSVTFFEFDEVKNKTLAGFLLAIGSSLHKMVFHHKRSGDSISKVWNFIKASASVRLIDEFP